MRVAFVLGHPNPFPGAAWARVRAHAGKFASGGDRVDVLGLITPTNLARAGVRRDGDVRLLNLAPGFSSNRASLIACNVASSLVSALLLWRLRPDVVVLSVPPGAPAVGGFLGARMARARIVLDYRDEWEAFALAQNQGRLARKTVADLSRWMERRYRRCDASVAVTLRLAESLRVRGVKDTVVVPNGAEIRTFRSVNRGSARAALGFGGDDLVLVYEGAIGGYYRLDVVVRAIERLPAKTRPSLLLLGEDVEGHLAKLRGTAGADLGGRIRHLPPQPDARGVAEVVAAGDVGLVPYDDDPLWRSAIPTKFYEYCAAGLPVLATAREDSILAQTIAEHRVGLVTPPLDVDRLAQAIERLAADPEERRRLGENARLYADRFDRGALAAEFARTVRALAGERLK